MAEGTGRITGVRWRRSWLVLLVAVALAPGLFAACGGDDSGGDDTGSSTAPAGNATAALTATAVNETAAKVIALEVPRDLVDGMAAGKKDAAAVLQVFEDFQCPNCLAYTVSFEQVIVDEYVKTGKLRYEFHNFPILGDESVYAAAGAVCAAQQAKFWEYHEKLFLVEAEANQLQAEKLNVGRFTPDALVGYARDTGLDSAVFTTCLQDPATLQTVQDDFTAARAAGLRGTPGFVLNGAAVAYPSSVSAFRQLLDAAIKPQ